jgi:hypothetical protein
LNASTFQSALFRNDGNGKFTMIPLPPQAQLSAVNGMVAGDFNGDGNLDIVLNGNDYGTEPFVGRYDAMNGLCLEGDGKGGFRALSILESGIYIPGDGKALVKLRGAGGSYLLAAGQNRGPLKLIELKKKRRFIPLQPLDVSAEIRYKNGSKRKEEFYYGSSFLSENGRFLEWDDGIQSVVVADSRGKTRTITLP